MIFHKVKLYVVMIVVAFWTQITTPSVFVMKVKNLVGQVFGRLTVVTQSDSNEQGRAMWACVCDCSNKLVVCGKYLLNGHTKSCGCLSREVTSEVKTTHGMAGTQQYQVWQNAKTRTTNPNSLDWPRYGGRGIEMCQEWLDSFEAFWRDMGPTWQEGLTLDREDPNGNYCLANCRWETEPVQSHNQRKRRGCSSRYKGVYLSEGATKFRANIGIYGKQKHLGYFVNESDAAVAHDNASEELYGDRPNGTINNLKSTKEDNNDNVPVL